jgi:hypothetical protein
MEPADQPKPRRLSLTKTQRQTEIGLELIELCQTITEDGQVLDQELEALKAWLSENRGSDFPAIQFLTKTVEQILADGKVTEEERTDLYQAIEVVLPTDIRESVRGIRLSKEREARSQAKADREAAKQEEKAEREKNTPVDRWDFIVAGVLYEGRARIVENHAQAGDTVFLARDRKNRYSRNATDRRAPTTCSHRLYQDRTKLRTHSNSDRQRT